MSHVGDGLRVVVTGATGNVGTSVVQALGDDPRIGSILGVARRVPQWSCPKVDWASADVAVDDLDALVTGADVLIHLAWRLQPARDLAGRSDVDHRERVAVAVLGEQVQVCLWGLREGIMLRHLEACGITPDVPLQQIDQDGPGSIATPLASGVLAE